MVNTGISNFFAYCKFHSDWGRVIGKIKQNEPDCGDTAPFMCQPEARGSCAAEQGRVNTWDRDELGALWVRIALHTFLFMRGLPGIGLKTNSERSDFLSVADPTRVIFVPVRDCTVQMQNGNESQTGCIKNSMFLRTAPSFLLFFFSKIRTLLRI